MRTHIIDIVSSEFFEQDPLISVLVLTYQHGKFLHEAIDSIIGQICDFPFEIVIAEDCSSDNSRAIAVKYQKQFPGKIRIISAHNNIGMHKNFHRGIDFCRGKYIAFCEGDDFWHATNKLQMQIALMESNSGISACHTEYDTLTRFCRNENIHRSLNIQHEQLSENAQHMFLENWSAATATFVYKRSIVRDFLTSNLYSDRWPFIDYGLALYASTKGLVAYLLTSTATYRIVAGSATNKGFREKLAMELATIECMELFIRNAEVPESISFEALSRRHALAYEAAYFCGNLCVMDERKRWLIEHGAPFNNFKHSLKRLMIKVAPIYKLHRWNWGMKLIRSKLREISG